MHKLNRASAPAPACLGGYRHGLHKWGDLSPKHRADIGTHLEKVQGRLCAYCEGSLDDLGCHIEHFRCRDHHPQHTFDWENLFWCCDRSDSCGHYKDSGKNKYKISDLIEPTSEDPDRFFRFNSNGTITIREQLSPRDRRRAEETIRVLNLDEKFGRLRKMRASAAKAYLFQDPSILDALPELSETERREWVQEELARTADEPFCTVIRHLLEGLA